MVICKFFNVFTQSSVFWAQSEYKELSVTVPELGLAMDDQCVRERRTLGTTLLCAGTHAASKSRCFSLSPGLSQQLTGRWSGMSGLCCLNPIVTLLTRYI